MLRGLDQAHHVAHPQDPLRHAIGVEELELLELLACGGKQDRLASQRAHRQRRAAARIAVELGDHRSIEIDRLGKRLGDVDGVLARHRIDHQQQVVRLQRRPHAHELAHQLLVHVQAPARVDDQHVLALGASTLERPRRDLDGISVGAALIRGGVRLRAQLHQLLDRRRAAGITGGERHAARVLLAQVARELCRRRRLARALQARHHDHGRGARGKAQRRRGAAHQVRELLGHDLHHLLAGVEPAYHLGPGAALAEVGRELLDHLEVDVGLEQRQPDLAHRQIDVALGERAAVAHLGERALQLVCERIEHRSQASADARALCRHAR